MLACCTAPVAAVLLGLAACGQGGSSGGSSPSSISSNVASSAPSAPPAHELSAGERKALAKAGAIVGNPQTSEEKQHLKGYAGEDARIVGYLVQSRAPGFTIGLLVSLTTKQTHAAGPQFGLEPWTTAAAKGPGERWAVATAEQALTPLIEQLAVTEVDTGVCGYVVGWPGVGELTMWIDLRGSLRGGVGIP